MRPPESEEHALLREFSESFAHVQFFRGVTIALIFSTPIDYLIWEFVKWHL